MPKCISFRPRFSRPDWRFSNYAAALEYFKFWQYLRNTMIIIVPSVIAGTTYRHAVRLRICAAAVPGKKLHILAVRGFDVPADHGHADPAVYHVDAWVGMHNSYLAAHPPVFLRRRRIQHLFAPPVYHDYSAGTGRGGQNRWRRLYADTGADHRARHPACDDRRGAAALHLPVERPAAANGLHQQAGKFHHRRRAHDLQGRLQVGLGKPNGCNLHVICAGRIILPDRPEILRRGHRDDRNEKLIGLRKR